MTAEVSPCKASAFLLLCIDPVAGMSFMNGTHSVRGWGDRIVNGKVDTRIVRPSTLSRSVGFVIHPHQTGWILFKKLSYDMTVLYCTIRVPNFE